MFMALVLAATIAGNQAVASAVPLADLVGEWVNANPQTRAVPSFSIRTTSEGVIFHASGGTPVKAVPFAPTVEMQPESATALLLASSGTRMFLVRPSGPGEIQLEMLTRLDDGSGRSDYQVIERFTRRQAE